MRFCNIKNHCDDLLPKAELPHKFRHKYVWNANLFVVMVNHDF